MIDDDIKKLRKEGHSYGEISKIVKRSRKFVWKKSKDVKFSEHGKKRYHREVKGIVNLIKPQNSKLTVSKIRVMGHILFDGMLTKSKEYHKIIRYINSSKELISQFIKDVKEIYGLEPTAFEIEKGLNLPTYKVTFSSKLMYEDLIKYLSSYSTTKNISLPDSIINANKKLKLEFLRAFFNDEGSISANGRIMADLKSKNILAQIVNMLKEFDLYFKMITYEDYKGKTYKIYLPKNYKNLRQAYELELFDKSIITHGHNIRRKKLDVLKEQCEKLKNQ